MIRKAVVVAALGLFLAASDAHAWNDIMNSIWGAKGNDTGGIIPWSRENEQRAAEIAQENCSRYNKIAVPRSIRRVYGDYMTYDCVFERPHRYVTRHHRRVNITIDK
jgi:hypothetical protein